MDENETLNEEITNEEISFEDLGLDEATLQAVEAKGFHGCPIHNNHSGIRIVLFLFGDFTFHDRDVIDVKEFGRSTYSNARYLLPFVIGKFLGSVVEQLSAEYVVLNVWTFA